MKATFRCPGCESPHRVDFSSTAEWKCSQCEQVIALQPPAEGTGLHHCALCGNLEFYRKKNFPHWLGMLILIAACVASVFTYRYYQIWLTWTILIGSAVLDGLLYWLVGDVVVCYRCQAHYHGLPNETTFPPFDLGVGERYRQERIRREQLHTAKKNAH